MASAERMGDVAVVCVSPLIAQLWLMEPELVLAVTMSTGKVQLSSSASVKPATGIGSTVMVTVVLSTHNCGLSATSVTSYLLPGDALQIRIWREPDLSGDFVVDEEGVVTLPMLGRISTADISVPELRGQLLAMYGLELRNPSITITPVRRVYVLGEVNRPGLYGLDPTASLASAVALAGGANREGDLRKLSLVRNGTPILSGIEPTTDLLSTGVRSGDQIFVDRRGWWERNQNFVVTSVLGIAGIVVAVIR